MAEDKKWRTVNTKIPSDLHRKIRFLAAKEDKKIKEVFVEALEEHLKRAAQ